jgi:hypothetical protein
MKGFKLDRIISITTLAAALIAIVLVLKKPAPVAPPPVPVVITEHASPVEQPSTPGQQQQAVQSQPNVAPGSSSIATAEVTPQSAKPGPQVNSAEISAALEKTLGSAAGTASLAADSNAGSGTPNIKDQQVTMEGDIVHGKFLTEVGGKDVWVTISGHMGEKDGYATFDPTEFKVGDMEVPVSLVNPALQRKLAEERDRLKVSNGAQ